MPLLPNEFSTELEKNPYELRLLLAQFSTNAAEAQSVRFDLNRAIKQRFDDAGIPFARRFPAEQARA